jgi:predicted porin
MPAVLLKLHVAVILVYLPGIGVVHAEERPTDKITNTQTKQETIERELSAEEDPLAKTEAEKRQRDKGWYDEPDNLRVYGSARIRYRDTGEGSLWGDGGSRIGVVGNWQVVPKRWLFGGFEAGFNLLDRVDQLIDSGSASGENKDDIFTRLAYVGIEGPRVFLTVGKNWSTYNKVASFTDRFEGTGGSASGVYNAQTDGGQTGTGRADGVLQTRFHIGKINNKLGVKPFKLNFQLQNGQPIPGIDGVDYGTAFGFSAIMVTSNEFTLGIAYNHADVKDVLDTRVSESGIDGDAQALVLGSRWFEENWYLGAVVARLENHETTDELVYFDGTGYEVYAQYRVKGPWWLTGGFNYLAPDDDQLQAGAYKIEYGVLGLRYSIDEFSRMLYFNIRFDNGALQDGETTSNIYTLGVRWDLGRTFSWTPKWRR